MRLSWSLGLVMAFVAVTSCGSQSHGGAAPGQSQPTTNPPVFLSAEGGNSSLVVRSVETGSVVRTLADNVGAIAISPNGATAFYQSGQPEQTPIYSVPVSGGTPVRVGSGTAPAVSPDSSKLVYALAGPGNVVAIYDVARRTTQRVDLSHLIGPGYNLDNTGSLLGWVSNTLLVVIPLQDASFAVSRRDAHGGHPPQVASAGPSTQKAVLIDLAAAHSERQVEIALPGGLLGVGGPGPSPGMLLIATEDTIDGFMVTPTAMTPSGSVAVPGGGIVEALSPDGHKALYLLRAGPTSPPPTEPPGGAANAASAATYQSGIQLWEATIDATFASPRLVVANAQLRGAPW